MANLARIFGTNIAAKLVSRTKHKFRPRSHGKSDYDYTRNEYWTWSTKMAASGFKILIVWITEFRYSGLFLSPSVSRRAIIEKL